MSRHIIADQIYKQTGIEVIPQSEIFKWLTSYFNIPEQYRVPSRARLEYLAEIFYPRILDIYVTRQMTPLQQMRLSDAIAKVGQPSQTKEPMFLNDGHESRIPYKIAKELADIISAMLYTETDTFQISRETVMRCKRGIVPAFKMKTLERLYPLLTGKKLEIPEEPSLSHKEVKGKDGHI